MRQLTKKTIRRPSPNSCRPVGDLAEQLSEQKVQEAIERIKPEERDLDWVEDPIEEEV